MRWQPSGGLRQRYRSAIGSIFAEPDPQSKYSGNGPDAQFLRQPVEEHGAFDFGKHAELVIQGPLLKQITIEEKRSQETISMSRAKGRSRGFTLVASLLVLALLSAIAVRLLF